MLTNQSIPPVTVIPTLAYNDAGEAARWLCEAFGFSVRLRIFDHRVQLNVGDGAVVATDGLPAGGVHPDHSIMVRVEDLDAHCARARRHGAEVVRDPESFPFGERQYTALDHAGHAWTFTESIEDVAPEKWGGERG